jgi:RNA-binding protein
MKGLKDKARTLQPIVNIGKNGMTDEIIGHVKMLIKKKKLMKVKFLRSYLDTHDKKKAAIELCERTGAGIIDQIGNIVTIYKR